MNLVEKQSRAVLPPEQLGCPPYKPGSLPPFTKLNPVGKYNPYSIVTVLAVVRTKGLA